MHQIHLLLYIWHDFHMHHPMQTLYENKLYPASHYFDRLLRNCCYYFLKCISIGPYISMKTPTHVLHTHSPPSHLGIMGFLDSLFIGIGFFCNGFEVFTLSPICMVPLHRSVPVSVHLSLHCHFKGRSVCLNQCA